jgi:hypothetical protein
MKTITQLLNKTPQQYESMIMETYLRWCMDFSINYGDDLQSIVANSKVNQYFLFEYAKGEAEFLKLIARFENAPTITIHDRQTLYNDCTFNIFNRNPKPLIQEAKKLKVYDNARN